MSKQAAETMAQGGHGIRPDHPERPAEFANRRSSSMLSQAAMQA
jgi:hypothetical protein